MSESSSVGPVPRMRRERPSPYSLVDKEKKEVKSGSGADSPQAIPRGAESSGFKLGSNAQLVSDRFLLLENLEGSNLRRAVDLVTQKEYACRAVSRQVGAKILEAHFRLEFSDFVAQPVEIINAGTDQFIFYLKNFGDVHGLVRDRQIRDEAHAQMVLKQIVNAVMDCHSAGVVLTDLKMRRFVFANAEKTKIVLETLEDATLLASNDDVRSYKRIGFPAYMAPEAICCTRGGAFAGRLADIWGVGVIIYTVLVGKYPFNDPNPLALFSKIVQGYYQLPEDLPAHAKCLIRNLLLKDPLERLTAEDILAHPWFADKEDRVLDEKIDNADENDIAITDQIVPSCETVN